MVDETGQDSGEMIPFKLAGRLVGRRDGFIQIDLVDGMTVSISEDDCKVTQEATDPVTKRSVVLLALMGNKPISATFQPHLFRVLAHSPTVPFAFGGAFDHAPNFDLTQSVARTFGPVGTGIGGHGGLGYVDETMGECYSRCQSWSGGWYNDNLHVDSKEDSIL